MLMALAMTVGFGAVSATPKRGFIAIAALPACFIFVVNGIIPSILESFKRLQIACAMELRVCEFAIDEEEHLAEELAANGDVKVDIPSSTPAAKAAEQPPLANAAEQPTRQVEDGHANASFDL